MAKKELLKTQMKRPVIKRTKVADEAKMEEAVQRVANHQDAAASASEDAPVRSLPTNSASLESNASNTTTAKQINQPKGRGGASKKRTAPAADSQPATVTKGPDASKQREPDEADKEPVKRMTIDLPQNLHKQLKLLSIREDIYMKDYIIKLIQESLGKRG